MHIDIHHSIRYQPVLPCKPKWQRNGVDLEKFSKLVDEEMTYLQAESNLSKCFARFTNILNSVADTHVGKTKSCWKADPWMTPLLWAKTQTRNRLRGTIKTNPEEWIEECRKANGVMNQVKKECWNEVLEGAMLRTGGKEIWKVINGLNGTPEANSTNEAMCHNSRTKTDAEGKVNIFVNHYARVSNLPMCGKDHNFIREFKKRIDCSSTAKKNCFKLATDELKSPIWKIKRKGAAATDNIPRTFLKALGRLPFKNFWHFQCFIFVC